MPHTSPLIQAWKPHVKADKERETYPEPISSLRRKKARYSRGYANPRTGWLWAAIPGETSVCCARLGSPACAGGNRTCPPGPQQVLLQYWSHFSLLCPSTPVRHPCSAGYNMALGNGGSTHSCSGLELEKYPEEGIAVSGWRAWKAHTASSSCRSNFGQWNHRKQRPPPEPVPSE